MFCPCVMLHYSLYVRSACKLAAVHQCFIHNLCDMSSSRLHPGLLGNSVKFDILLYSTRQYTTHVLVSVFRIINSLSYYITRARVQLQQAILYIYNIFYIYLNRNCLLRFDKSIVSMSITSIL